MIISTTNIAKSKFTSPISKIDENSDKPLQIMRDEGGIEDERSAKKKLNIVDEQQQDLRDDDIKQHAKQGLNSDADNSLLSLYEYWKRGSQLSDLEFRPLAMQHEDKDVNDLHERFVTFEDDAGGWNNIRMAFECFVLVARLTQRTLVLPPKVKFYLLDYGPIKVFKNRQESYSTYYQYFDLKALGESGLQIITTDEFLKRYRFENLPTSILSSAIPEPNTRNPPTRNGVHTPWFMYLRNHSDTIIWPSGPKTMGQFALTDPDKLRKLVYHKRIIHFPVHLSLNLRYLDGAPVLVQSAHPLIQQFAKVFLRNHLRYTTEIQTAARQAIDKLGGPLKYSCIHIRRNELQYKTSFLSAKASLDNIKGTFLSGETIYIATDETEKDFFQAFINEGFQIKQYKDVRRDEPNKFDGMIEQLICAFGRVFVATSTSTFSSYINRLRLYIWRNFHTKSSDAADLHCYFHDNKKDSGSNGHLCGRVGFSMLDGAFA